MEGEGEVESLPEQSPASLMGVEAPNRVKVRNVCVVCPNIPLASTSIFVMPGLLPGIHSFSPQVTVKERRRNMDGIESNASTSRINCSKGFG